MTHPSYSRRYEMEVGPRAIDVAAFLHPPVAAVSIVTHAIIGTAGPIDGVALTVSMRVYLALQTDPTQNGIWVVQTGAWTRPTDWASGSLRQVGEIVLVAPGGTTNFPRFGNEWMVTTGGVVDAAGIISFPHVDKSEVALVGGSLVLSSRWVLIGAQATATDSMGPGVFAAVSVDALTAGAGTGTVTLLGSGGNTVRVVIVNF